MNTPSFVGKLILLATLASCASAIEKAHQVSIKDKEPPKECKHVGAVVASPLTEKESQDEIRARLEERAMAKGGNYIYLETVDARGGLTGMAYRCP